MEFLLFVIFSSMEYLAVFAIMFVLFRFEYKFYHNSVIFICAILSFVSYSIRYGFHQDFLAPIAQVLLIFAFLYYIFEIQIFYSGIMTVTGSLFFGIIQTVLYILLDRFGIITEDGLVEHSVQGYTLQFISSLIVFILAILIKKRNYGFAYVPHGQRAFVRYQGLNRMFLYLMILGIIFILALFYFNIEEPYVILITIILTVIFIALMYLSVRKEYQND
ncbi:hypothetical protein [Paenibacillus koleovorans]|uniref:hypothetical protein n=1 Tax=Paenibacillus koleovorans TaxID=121608 RepID=UPI000FD7EE91|nr:hypothetical protein [Paenibacillus koleovorans]